ncbi:tetratricopeptide (TPR) repeat protein [Breznakia sp. PF5-3]|uniref:tetratricopeptide repeat protein n=1 Tax=unclassified Breznakia TaxID=2623764 RepID=UPI0024050E5B|nr:MULTISPECIES: hypothetical protein [unclassified Breznakia]MDF9824265.1 tetratricopeptide (TPR) repeat protein [Breznakia sp. PM6-1]MDF9835489.1 tetratricopeptide (TPR) repeat protein [Breznakia sp. PF5-3]MDF9838037.1 tetratricopeptide (TPR) repeat protein [Breznakia sp. PFB2-8]MDF9859415.1 tetratricopeptide (TPR) repeat protein [Breznakia sp. PH5-24]
MDDMNRKLDAYLKSKNIVTEDELKKAMEEFIDLYNTKNMPVNESKMSQAYDYLEQAQSANTLASAKKYAKKALEICPDCLDATMFLAELEPDFFKKEKMMLSAIEIEEKKLKKEHYFEKDMVGNYYGVFETRPYIRALYQLAFMYAVDGRIKKVIEICKEILRLNENDNTGSRYLLMAAYAYIEDEKALKTLYTRYEYECLETLIPFLIIYYKQGDYGKAKEYLNKINKANQYFKSLYLDDSILNDLKVPDGYFAIGEPSEVKMYFEKYSFLLDSVNWLDEFINKKGNIR